MTIQQKLNTALAGILLIVLVIAVTQSVHSEKQLSNTLVHDLLQDKASGYLDSMNMLMISGAIANRELLRDKLLADDVITEARMIRSEKIDALYGKGMAHEYPADELDQRALSGETVLLESSNPQGRTITYIEPIRASADYRGTNCLGCHQASEGDILGATRITYSMAGIDGQIEGNMFQLITLQGSVMAVAIVVLSLLLRQLIVSPTRNIQQKLRDMENNSDLTVDFTARSRDEIGDTASSLNNMVKRFAQSLSEVVSSANQVEHSASEISSSSSKARQAAETQRNESRQLLQGIDDLMASTSHVTDNARESTESARLARDVANAGMEKTSLAVDHISAMNGAIQETANVISTLDERSSNVGSVLGVIKEIAEQTNLLALNAAIEAARAGESGRGFAVVADEVRTLSQRTHDSAREIENMIGQLQSEARNAVGSMNTARETAEEGVSRIRDAAEALNHMISKMDRMTELSQATLSSMEQQLAVGSQVSDGIHRINNESVASVSSAEATNKIADELLGLSQRLGSLVRQFRL